MENQTFRGRLNKLAQKSRKALRLYSSMGRISAGKNVEYTEMQVREWKEINAELLKKLSTLFETASSKRLVSEVFALRDQFYAEWRMSETELHCAHKQLIGASENGDFVKAANLSRTLVGKARVQATQAAHHELQDVINQSRVTQPPIELSDAQALDPEPSKPTTAKVIPLRKRSRVG